MTKEELRAGISLLKDLSTAATMLRQDIVKNLGTEDCFNDILVEVQEGSRTDVEDILKAIFKSTDTLDEMEDGDKVDTVYVEYKNLYNIGIGIQYPEGDKLEAYLSESDYGTFQAGSVYHTPQGNIVDLAMSEIKRGELAEIAGLSKDNKDIDIMVWSDESSEDYTHKYSIKQKDIADYVDDEDTDVVGEPGVKATGITLLSIDEYKEAKPYIPELNEWWWLRSPGDSSEYAADVNSGGSVVEDGINVDYEGGAVRPALQIDNLKSLNLNLGDKIEMAGLSWTVIPRGMALCDESVGYHAFHHNWRFGNDYEKSDVKKFIEKWAKDNNILS